MEREKFSIRIASAVCKALIVACFLDTAQSFAVSPYLAATNLESLQEQIDKKLACERGTYAVAFKDLQTGDTLFINERKLIPAASTIKIPVMIEAFRQVQEGSLSFEDSMTVTNQFTSLVDGSNYTLYFRRRPYLYAERRFKKKVSVHDLVYYMITVSSNIATNLLIDKVGPERINETIREMGAMDTQVVNGVLDSVARARGQDNMTSAHDLMIILDAIVDKKVVSTEACDQMIDILLQQRHRDRIPAKLPAEAKVAHKTGTMNRLYHDAGVIFLPDGRAYILAILSQGVSSHHRCLAVMSDISRMIYDWMTTSDSQGIGLQAQ